MITSIALVALSAAAPAVSAPPILAPTAARPVLAGLSAEWDSPTFFVEGVPYMVTVDLTAPAEGCEIDAWALTAAAFEVNGKPTIDRAGGKLALAPNQTMSFTVDLGPYISGSPSFSNAPFSLKYAYPEQGEPLMVEYGQAADKGLDFMTMPVEELSNYIVLISTNRGDMIAEFWPDVAPNHVRNFLDLSYTGFYDGVPFHRVIPGFMIQGGDPTGTGTGSGKRQLKAEFNDRKHVPGVLSMARSASPDSASCQFFVMHGTAKHLDGQYSGFGQLMSGIEVVNEIVNTPRGPGDRPTTKQEIKRAVVLKRPAGGE